MSGMGETSKFTIEKFRHSEGPTIDVRSPGEFSKGHLPRAINLPLFSDCERKEIGITYKNSGRTEAIQLGLRYTGPKMEKLSQALKKIAQQKQEASENPSATPIKIYCWRGGMRSSSMAWLADLIGLGPVLLEGGYKSYRRWVLQRFESRLPLILLGGRTGTGKTDLLKIMKEKHAGVIDLEGLANHRGSSFGGLGLQSQPTNEQFENLLAEELDCLSNNHFKEIWLEAESLLLGKCRIPHDLFKQMKSAPIVEIMRSEDERIVQLIKVYSPYGIKALQEATQRISKRLGPQRTSKAMDAIAKEDWGKACQEILDYYDRCYDYELSKSPSHLCIDISGLTTSAAARQILEKSIKQIKLSGPSTQKAPS